ncbi:MOSC domain-containing protein [Hyphomicrobium sp.]|uniref:MOSC domain-containing protein n=1 Tax=Hyphomicrobium sp. TaxID=82 RepID=UPI002D78742F|nr:MOSC domain-containing protein [Hyphomicrobium sp.]HET6387831.1 MOSC domain-containing protein [Hyphomicrobium sp.]
MKAPSSPPPQSMLAKLLAGPMAPGKLVWIGLRPARSAPMIMPGEASLVAQQGIEGDRYRTQRNGPRQVTLIAAEDIAAIASFLGRETVAPELLRRNLVTSGINLLALKGSRFRIGTTLLEATGDCAPCSQMEANLGPGGYNAVRGRGGLTARIVEGGTIRIGDSIERNPQEQQPAS